VLKQRTAKKKKARRKKSKKKEPTNPISQPQRTSSLNAPTDILNLRATIRIGLYPLLRIYLLEIISSQVFKRRDDPFTDEPRGRRYTGFFWDLDL
jgi:hypothetical protein